MMPGFPPLTRTRQHVMTHNTSHRPPLKTWQPSADKQSKAEDIYQRRRKTEEYDKAMRSNTPHDSPHSLNQTMTKRRTGK